MGESLKQHSDTTTNNINEEELSIMFFVCSKLLFPGGLSLKTNLPVTLMTIKYLASTFESPIVFGVLYDLV